MKSVLFLIFLSVITNQSFARYYDYEFYLGTFGPDERSWFFSVVQIPIRSMYDRARYTTHYWSEVEQYGDYWEQWWSGEVNTVNDPRYERILPSGPYQSISGVYSSWFGDYWGNAFIDPRDGTLYAYIYHSDIFKNGSDGIRTTLLKEGDHWKADGTSALGHPYSLTVTYDEIIFSVQVISRTYEYKYYFNQSITPEGSFFEYMYADDRNWPWVNFTQAALWGYCVGENEDNFYFYNWTYQWCWTSKLYWPWIYIYTSGDWIKLEVEDD